MNSARIAELLDPFLRSAEKTDEQPPTLSEKQLESISIYIDILIRWNARVNLTAIRNDEDVVTRHFGESLFAARHLFPAKTHVATAASAVEPERSELKTHLPKVGQPGTSVDATAASPPDARSLTSDAACSVADVGSGAGFPGLPIKLWAPQISLTLIESNHKKAAFLREVTRALTLTDVNIQNTRAESLTLATFNLVTLRAVERFESILPYAAALVAPAGRLALLISAAQQSQAEAILPELAWSEPVPIPLSRSKILVVGQKD